MIGNESKVEVLEVQLDSLKSKVFILFALLVLTVGGLIYCLFTLLSQASPGLIQATRIQVVDDDGFPVIDLYRSEFDRHSAGRIKVNSSKVPIPDAGTLPAANSADTSDGTTLVSIGADAELEVGVASGFSVLSFDQSKDIWFLGSNEYGTKGRLELQDHMGEIAFSAYVGRNNEGVLFLGNGGSIHMDNRFDETVLSMFPSESGNGQIVLRERKDPNGHFQNLRNADENLSVSQILPDKPDRPSGDQ